MSRLEPRSFPDPDPYSFEDPERGSRPINPEPAWRSLLRKLWAPIVGLGLLIWKAKFVFAAIFKFKAIASLASMFASVGAYALLWGWQFGVGFVALILVHELGHYFEARRQGVPVAAPMFVPFLGAYVMHQRVDDPTDSAKISLAGPIVGSLGAAGAWAIGAGNGSDLMVALAFTGFLLNLINLAPIVPLDGGAVLHAIRPSGGWRFWRRRSTEEMLLAPPPRMTAAQRAGVLFAYFGLIAVLVLAMFQTYVQRDA